ncbi:helix-turn-helix domain-containing protein [Actinophytocola sp.]|uniref:helix-turn-helix domain-containing protein n=1 Tax=Actinophytocola sp. TaxID=1872138 RepID=UPI003899ABE0
MSERRRVALRTLPPDLAGPVRVFTEEFRGIFERLGLNQRQLAEKLHLSKSPVSRYLNGQEIIPVEALNQVCQLAHLAPQEGERLRDLRDQAKAALSGAVAAAEEPPVDDRPWSRRLVWGTAVAVVLVATAVLLVRTGRDSDSSACAPAHRQYTVTTDGDVLDENHNDIGDVRRGETFVRDTPTSNPYRSRYYGHIVGRNGTGFVDQAKLDYIGKVCDRAHR